MTRYLSHLEERVAVMNSFAEIVREVRTEMARGSALRISAVEAKSKEQRLRRGFESAKAERLVVARQDKDKKLASLIERGMADSTLVDSANRVIDSDAVADIGKMNQDLTEALELIAFASAREKEESAGVVRRLCQKLRSWLSPKGSTEVRSI